VSAAPAGGPPGGPRITLDDVAHVARLARLALSPEDRERMRRELDAILGYVAKLQALPTADVPPTSHVVPLAGVMREDEPRPCLPREAMLANAPESTGELFRVPRIIEE
jgi:aspartyl-tRNA(Asn)/glutamyl-tRNA(Gln) amidotransferase subunit C